MCTDSEKKIRITNTISAGLSSHVVTSVSHGQCFKFNGGILTKDGYKWYEVQDVNGHHVS
jgi:hypothetical protein